MIDTMIIPGDARQIDLPDRSVQCVVTSPPYFGLRDYGFEGQIGQESTPELYVDAIVEVFREVRRVLRDDGTVWLNLGDGYNNNPSTSLIPRASQGNGAGGFQIPDEKHVQVRRAAANKATPLVHAGIKKKDLIGIPWMVAFALRADGWYLRADIVWAKGVSLCPSYAGSAMPESVTDRPSRTHEYVFLLTKSPRYFYDVEAVKEQGTGASGGGWSKKYAEAQPSHGAMKLERPAQRGTRNLRSVWTINPKPYAGAHFATMPPALADVCIRAGTSEHGACSACGAPYTRIIEKGDPNRAQQLASGGGADGEYNGQATKDFASAGAQDASATKARILAGMLERRTIGWKPGCACDAPVRPCIVLDPFAGSGTTPAVAHTLGRIGVGIEPNPEYLVLALERLQSVGAI